MQDLISTVHSGEFGVWPRWPAQVDVVGKRRSGPIAFSFEFTIALDQYPGD
ncbi:MAG: hypothetical protein WBL23_10400 [Salinisphaera sp.]|uniref:hypothetical protein n=1 Tax=Salinisphaera sp. TaxID=1914330 RepID=UPI003C7C335B